MFGCREIRLELSAGVYLIKLHFMVDKTRSNCVRMKGSAFLRFHILNHSNLSRKVLFAAVCEI